MSLDIRHAAIVVLSCLVLVFVLSLALFSTVLAVDEYVTLPVGQSILGGYPTLTIGDPTFGNFVGNSTKSGTYIFAYPSSLQERNPPSICAVSLDNTAVVNMGIQSNYALTINNYSESYQVYYVSTAPNSIDTFRNCFIPMYASRDEGLADIAQHLGVYTPPSTFQYTLPPGNVAYIPIPRGMSESITFTLTTTYYMAFGNNDTSRINQVVTVMSSLPSESSNLAPSAPKIPWTNNGSVNLLGVSANKIYQGSIPSNYGGQYLVVVNPMTMPSQGGLIGGDTYTNGSINISVSAVAGSPHIYPMSESLTITPGDGIGSESSYGDAGYTYVIDSETGEIVWTDPNGGNEAPVAGGNNPMPTPNTIFDWLRNISQQLSDFLRGPVQAVQVVVSAIRDFMGSFTQLYQWLPSPVYSLITSALMIALTIGVIKIFV